MYCLINSTKKLWKQSIWLEIFVIRGGDWLAGSPIVCTKVCYHITWLNVMVTIRHVLKVDVAIIYSKAAPDRVQCFKHLACS